MTKTKNEIEMFSKKKKKFNWSKFKFEYGRYHYITNHYGEVVNVIWLWEPK